MWFSSDKNKCLIVWTMMALGYSLTPEWQYWLMNSRIGSWLGLLLSTIERHGILIFLLIIASVAITYRIAERILHDEDIRYYRPFVFLFGLQLLWVENTLTTPNIYGWFDFRLLWTLCLTAILICFPVKWLKCKPRKVTNTERPSFSLDTIDSECESDSLKKYGDAIVSHILGTKLEGQSFGIGITGAWGSGKTTFLELLASKLEGKVELVAFNPWLCKSPEQLTEDFFMTLRKKLSPKHSVLSKPIKEYAKFVSSATVPIGDLSLSRLALTIPEENLMERKKKLSEIFARLDKPVVVLIDDLDRLESDEVFEVLRLIRNTADLSNVFYIATYDKDYVIGVLEHKGINNAGGYLEKIFPVELPQPKVEENQLYLTLYDELSKHHKYGNRLPQNLFRQIDQPGRELTTEILNNYRRIKRFSRLFLLNLDYIGDAFRNEFGMIDLYWLGLLQMYDKNTYNVLKENRSLILVTVGEQYSLRHGIKKNEVPDQKEWFAYKGEAFWEPLTPEILEILFDKKDLVTKYSMRHSENYDKYFTLSVSKYRLSFSSFDALLERGCHPTQIVKEWVNSGKYYSSILFQFEHKEVQKLSSMSLGNYIRGLLEVTYKTAGLRNDKIYQAKYLLRHERYAAKQQPTGRGHILGWFCNEIDKDGNLELLGKMLKRFYIHIETDQNGRQKHAESLLISNDDVKMLLRFVMQHYMERHEMTALDILNEKSDTGKVFGNCCVCLEDCGQEYYDNRYENVVFDMVTSYLEKKQKPTDREFDEAMNKMFQPEPTEFLNPEEEQDYYSSIEEDRDIALSEYFGSEWDKVNEFKKRCFIK